MAHQDSVGRAGIVHVDLRITVSDGGAVGVLWNEHDRPPLEREVAATLWLRDEVKTWASSCFDPVNGGEAAKRLGRALGNLLCPSGDIRDRFDALRASVRLVIALRITPTGDGPKAKRHAAALRSLPWELSFIDTYLSLDSIELVRHAEPPGETTIRRPNEPLRILVFEGPRKRLPDAKVRAILESSLPDTVDVVIGSTREALREHLNHSEEEKYDLVVFDGHGFPDALMIEDPRTTNRIGRLTGNELAAMLNSRVRAVVLIACDAGQAAKDPDGLLGVAESLAEHGIPTLAFQTQINEHKDKSYIDETRAVATALARAVAGGTTLREATAAVRQSLVDLKTGDSTAFARPVLWQPSPVDVWISEPPSVGPDASWDITHRSARAERPWGEGVWLQRPGNAWDVILSPDGEAWARRTRRGVEVALVKGARPWTVTTMDADATPIAISPVDSGEVSVLTKGERTTDWLVRLDSDISFRRRETPSRAHQGAWVSDRFVWADTEGNVYGSGDLSVADVAHICNAQLRKVRMVAWIDSNRTLWVHRQRNGEAELRSLPLPELVAEVDELAVAPTADGPDRVWIRLGDTWQGCSWDSIGPAHA